MACKRYRCDACMAVSHQISQKFAKNTKKKMKSWDVMEVLDDTCKEAAFPGYGVKLVDGENALSGPGIERDESLQPGGASIQGMLVAPSLGCHSESVQPP